MPDDYPSQDLAWRFVLAYDGTSLSITEVSVAEMRVGPTDPTDDMTGVTGFWYELLDADGTVLFRRITSSPMTPHAEVASPDGDFARGPRDIVAGEFELVTPVLGDATTLAIFGTDAEQEAEGAPAGTLAVFDLGDFL